MFAILCKGGLATAGQPAQGEGDFPSVGFINGHVASIFQPGQVGGQVTFREASFPLQVEEIGAFDRGEDAHNHQTGWLVDQPVKFAQAASQFIMVRTYLTPPWVLD